MCVYFFSTFIGALVEVYSRVQVSKLEHGTLTSNGKDGSPTFCVLRSLDSQVLDVVGTAWAACRVHEA